jgi:hypothetical protein
LQEKVCRMKGGGNVQQGGGGEEGRL